VVVVAVVPWFAPLFKSLEFPGGWKVEFQELQKAAIRAEQAGSDSAFGLVSGKAFASLVSVSEQFDAVSYNCSIT